MSVCLGRGLWFLAFNGGNGVGVVSVCWLVLVKIKDSIGFSTRTRWYSQQRANEPGKKP